MDTSYNPCSTDNNHSGCSEDCNPNTKVTWNGSDAEGTPPAAVSDTHDSSNTGWVDSGYGESTFWTNNIAPNCPVTCFT